MAAQTARRAKRQAGGCYFCGRGRIAVGADGTRWKKAHCRARNTVGRDRRGRWRRNGSAEDLHGFDTPAALVVALRDAASTYYGAVGAEWLRLIVEDRPKLAAVVASGIKQFVEEFVPNAAAGQVERVARRFGPVAAAGEMATRYGLTGWAPGEATAAVGKCFGCWLEGFGGTGNREERALLSQVRAFFEQHGASRFEAIDGDQDKRIVDRAGFYRADADGHRET